MKNIAEFYIKKLIPSDKYLNVLPCKDRSLLLPEFNDAVSRSIAKFQSRYPDVEVVFVETFRSNALQLKHFKNRASKIKSNGMHHYGIAVDLAFKIEGEFSYQGDYKYLRECHEMEGLKLLGLWDAGHVQYVPVVKQADLRNTVLMSIKEFQKQNGLTPDGIVGAKTIAKAKTIYLT